jgi:hypothetical protein
MRWFAAIFASFSCASAGAADGLELPVRFNAAAQRATGSDAPARPAAPESAPRLNLPSLGRDPLVENALRVEREDALVRSGCRFQDLCYEAAEGRVVYRGARRYMPAWHGMAPEGVSLKRDRLVLRYSFR